MKIYTYYQSSASYRVRIALNLKGLISEMAFINLLNAEQKDVTYANINPQKVVPTLIDKDRTLTQSLAIIEYLDEAYPSPALLPKDLFARAYERSLSLVIAADTAPLGNLKVRKYLESEMGQDKAKIDEWMRHWIEEGLEACEKMLARESLAGTFCYGNTPTMADCCLMPQLYNALRWHCDLAPYPTIERIKKSCDAHDAFIAAHPSKQPDAV